MQTLNSIFEIPEERLSMGGCQDCAYGYIDPPSQIPGMSLAESRRIQFKNGALTFCDCHAGETAKAWCQRQVSDDDEYMKRRAETIVDSARVPPKYRHMTAASYVKIAGSDPEKRPAIEMVKEYYESGCVSTFAQDFKGIMLWGPVGTGKTGLLTPLFTHLVKEGRSGLWMLYSEMLAWLKEFDSGEVPARMERLKTVDLLFIDDIGNADAGQASSYNRDNLFRIIDHRNNHDLPVFCTSNLDPNQMAAQVDERTVRRLTTEMCATCQVGGKPMATMMREMVA